MVTSREKFSDLTLRCDHECRRRPGREALLACRVVKARLVASFDAAA